MGFDISNGEGINEKEGKKTWLSKRDKVMF
jgi:hypothetical protein